MVVDFSNISMPMAALMASMIGATATITAAILQLRMAWRREMLARAEHKPITRKAKRGPVTAVFMLLIASAIGGFALSQYLMSERQKKGEMLEQDLVNRIDQLAVSAQRLENIRMSGESDVLRQLRIEEAVRLGQEGVVTLLGVGKCSVQSTDGSTGEPGFCNEPHATRVQLCTELPITATVSAIELYARVDDEPGPWSEKKLTIAGTDFGGGRFSEKSSERVISESTRQICYGLSYWNSEFGLQARMVVRYVPSLPGVPEQTAAAVLAPAAQ